ncbi:SDR family NAD(P)-dependent oxidoreductase [Micromonospora sp. DT233]|uniref:SDR family NAD(P)-dependent oxidoreductase n=1 Tax=Micromonospora sp. DT233 TaxID=3393432 RepID=UPI003CF4AD3A
MVLLGETLDDFTTQLDTAIAGGPLPDGVVPGTAGDAGKIAFVFPGQGSQWARMAVELMDTSPVFQESLRECEAALAPYVEWSLIAVLRREEEWSQVDVVQPALFAVMVSLAAVWRSLGVEPAAVVGHSQGEIAAACVAGALTLPDAAKVVALRSRALRRLAGGGGMLSVPLSAADVAERIGEFGDRLTVAAVNGPQSTVVAGESAAIEELLAGYQQGDVQARRIPVDYASHSAQVEILRDEIREMLADIRPQPARIALYSTLTGERLADTTRLDADYWYRNLRGTVRFEQTIGALVADGHRCFVESSAHPVLTLGVRETLEQADVPGVVTGTLRRHEGGWGRFLMSAAQIWTRGVDVDWTAPPAMAGARRIELPPYAFQRRRFWISADRPADVAAAGLTNAGHALLGATVALAEGGATAFTARLSPSGQAWLADHRIGDQILFPGTAYVDLALHAADRLGLAGVDELLIEAPLLLPDRGAVEFQLLVAPPGSDGSRAFTAHARADTTQPWTRHATGTLGDGATEPMDGPASWPPEAEPVDVSAGYELLAARGLRYGPAFRGLTAAWRSGVDAFAEVVLDDEITERGFGLHPALLDAALHSLMLLGDDGVRLPFSWTGVRLYAVAARTLHVRLRSTGTDAVAISATDPAGLPVFTAELSVRTVEPGRLRSAVPAGLFAVDWAPVVAAKPGTEPWALLGADRYGLASALRRSGATVRVYDDVTQLRGSGEPEPRFVLVCRAPSEDPATGLRTGTRDALALARQWLDGAPDDRSILVFVTCGAVDAQPGDAVPHPADAAVWGLVRSAQAEHPGRFALLDLDGQEDSVNAVARILRDNEPQIAVRHGAGYVPRLARADAGDILQPPADGSLWRLALTAPGAVDGLSLQASDDGSMPLRPGEVRIAVCATGLNFRDVLLALGMVPSDERPAAGEASGVVVEIGSGVSGLVPGDRVMGLMRSGIGPLAVTDERLVTRAPAGLTFAESAAIPIAFLTAYYGLFDLAGLRGGESLLVHAATGGVGMAAVQLARHRGAEVYATAGPAKWATLRGQGVAAERIASSRSLDFEPRLRAASGGGVDVVLNSLANEYVDASLRLLRDGGRFLEMGKTDKRDPAEVSAAHPGVSYRIYDLLDAGPDRIQEMLAELREMFDAGSLRPVPVTAWDIAHARQAIRYFSQTRHIGKIIMTLPRPLADEGTVLITGGTGVLGGSVARHLATQHKVRHLVLAGRRGAEAEGARELADELGSLGAEVTFAACDVGDRASIAAMLAAVPADHPLTAVVHAAGVLDDGVLTSLTEDQLATVLRPKAEAAWHLHELTRNEDLSAFVVFSSAAGTLGNPGQGNYAAANAFLDALCAHRRARGLPATSIAWGLWERASAMTGHLGRADLARLTRSGTAPIMEAQGLAMLDAAWELNRPLVVAMNLDAAAMRQERGELPPLLSALDRTKEARRRAGTGRPAGDDTWARRLGRMSEEERLPAVLALVLGEAAAILGHGNTAAVDPGQPFKELGFDSLTAVELRNRLGSATGLRLSATAVFDHPTAAALAAHVLAELSPAPADPAAEVLAALDRIEASLAGTAWGEQEQARLTARLDALSWKWAGEQARDQPRATADDLSTATDAELFAALDDEIGLS